MNAKTKKTGGTSFTSSTTPGPKPDFVRERKDQKNWRDEFHLVRDHRTKLEIVREHKDQTNWRDEFHLVRDHGTKLDFVREHKDQINWR
ncbi:MAG: hypothetical protein SGI98_10735, partial [Verrucomicrobiota bacterium]|nr:hypothetical protein [Verrucomicrobiota bacterium]